jgi:ribosomal protein S18 acetylase RimI-like enzyme
MIFTIDVMTPDDVLDYRALRLASLREAPPAFASVPEQEEKIPLETMAERLVETPDSWMLGGFVNGDLAAIARFTRGSEPDRRGDAYVTGLYVDRLWRRNGFARALMLAIIRRASRLPDLQRLNLGVVVTNQHAIRLYESLGFTVLSTNTEAFARDGATYAEHMMGLALQRPAPHPR